MNQFTKFCLFFMIFLYATTFAAIADELSDFSAIHSSELEDYSTYAFKFTYMGAQFKIIPTNGGHGANRTFNVDDFKPYQRSNYRYKNDDLFVGSVINLTNIEFKAFVDAIGNYPELQSIDDVNDPNASLMIIRDYDDNTICWEHLSTRNETVTLFILLYDSIDPSRQDVLEQVRKCRGHMGGY